MKRGLFNRGFLELINARMMGARRVTPSGPRWFAATGVNQLHCKGLWETSSTGRNVIVAFLCSVFQSVIGGACDLNGLLFHWFWNCGGRRTMRLPSVWNVFGWKLTQKIPECLEQRETPARLDRSCGSSSFFESWTCLDL